MCYALKAIFLEGTILKHLDVTLFSGVKAENGLHVADEVHAMPSMQQTGVDDNDGKPSHVAV